MRTKFILLICILLVISACKPTIKTNSNMVNTTTVETTKSDTTFLDQKLIRDKYWIEYRPGGAMIKTRILKFLNDTVVKYYFGDNSCMDENYTSWFKAYDCYKIYNDTLETIEKLVSNPKNDDKYVLDQLSWSRKYNSFKFYVFEGDTILSFKDKPFDRDYHTLHKYKAKYKIKYQIKL